MSIYFSQQPLEIAVNTCCFMQITNTTIFHLLHFHGNTRNLPFTFFRKLRITVILWRNWRCHNLHFFIICCQFYLCLRFLKNVLINRSLMKMKTIKCRDFLYIKLDWLLGNQTTWKIKYHVVLLKQQVLKPQIVNYASKSSPTGINHSVLVYELDFSTTDFPSLLGVSKQQ